jgi:hypothetical protein
MKREDFLFIQDMLDAGDAGPGGVEMMKSMMTGTLCKCVLWLQDEVTVKTRTEPRALDSL